MYARIAKLNYLFPYERFEHYFIAIGRQMHNVADVVVVIILVVVAFDCFARFYRYIASFIRLALNREHTKKL